MSIEQQNRMHAIEIAMEMFRGEVRDLRQSVTNLTHIVAELKEQQQAAAERAERTGKQDGIRQGSRGKAKA